MDVNKIFGIKNKPTGELKTPERQSIEQTEDYAVKKVINTQEGTIEKVPVNPNDIVNKDYVDNHSGGNPFDQDLNTYDNVTFNQVYSKYFEAIGTIISDGMDSIELVDSGTGYVDGTFNVSSPGYIGTVDIVTDGFGVVTSVSINNKGTLFVVNDICTIEDGNFDATIRILSVIDYSNDYFCFTSNSMTLINDIGANYHEYYNSQYDSHIRLTFGSTEFFYVNNTNFLYNNENVVTDVNGGGDLNIGINNYFYIATSKTEDTVDDIRLSASLGLLKVEKCTVASGTKGGGTWI
jgi:hypothetical protein